MQKSKRTGQKLDRCGCGLEFSLERRVEIMDKTVLAPSKPLETLTPDEVVTILGRVAADQSLSEGAFDAPNRMLRDKLQRIIAHPDYFERQLAAGAAAAVEKTPVRGLRLEFQLLGGGAGAGPAAVKEVALSPAQAQQQSALQLFNSLLQGGGIAPVRYADSFYLYFPYSRADVRERNFLALQAPQPKDNTAAGINYALFLSYPLNLLPALLLDGRGYLTVRIVRWNK
jgi:hypothetical protein